MAQTRITTLNEFMQWVEQFYTLENPNFSPKLLISEKA